MTNEDYRGPGWKLEAIRPAEGRYLLNFGDGGEWEVRFSNDHSTMYVNVYGEEEKVIKRDKSEIWSLPRPADK
jgi:hypothetical protein